MAQSPPGFRKVAKSVVVVGYAKGSVFYSYGTAFCIKTGGSTSTFLTADHVVHPKVQPPPGSRLVILLPNAQSPIVASDSGLPHSVQADLAEVSAPAGRMRALKIGTSLPEPTQPIVVAGFPLIVGSGLFKGETPVSLSALLGSVMNVNPSHVLIWYTVAGGAVDHGMAGGPVFDPRTGVVYGVTQGYVPGLPVLLDRDQTTSGLAGQSAQMISSAYYNVAISTWVIDAFLRGQPFPGSVIAPVEIR